MITGKKVNDLILDSSVWIALLDAEDSQHLKAKKHFKSLRWRRLFLPDCVFEEVLNVLRRKKMSDAFVKFLGFARFLEAKVKFLNYAGYVAAGEHYVNFQNISFTDSLILATARELKADLVSFDTDLIQAYQKLDAGV